MCAEAQPTKVMRLGFVATVSPSSISPGYTIDFYQRLGELGWVKGKNLLVEERWAHGEVDRMPALIAEVLEHKVDAIVVGTDLGAKAARKATHTVPIIGVALSDVVASGIAQSLARPGGNFTGLSLQMGEGVPGKRLELLKESLPKASKLAVLWNPDLAFHHGQVRELETVAPKLGIKLRLIDARSGQGVRRAFQQARKDTQGAILLEDPMIYSNRREVTSVAARYRVPTIYSMLDYVPDGGLMAYGPDMRVMYLRAAEYVDKVLRGTNPGDIPVEQSTRLRLVINLKAAEALGLNIPEPVLLRADEVIR
jgi:putative tryptophan/tyrosine transport system substrate-binding protein